MGKPILFCKVKFTVFSPLKTAYFDGKMAFKRGSSCHSVLIILPVKGNLGKDLGSLLTSYVRNTHQSWDI